MSEDLKTVLAEARTALKAGQPRAAARAYKRAQQLSPRDPEIPHERGLALLESGDIGLAAAAQAEALALDPEHTGAHAQRAAALEALGDDEGAARELDELLHRIGPNLPLQARYIALGESARRARERRLLGNPAARLAASPLATSLARSIGEPLVFKAPFVELRAYVGDTIAAGNPAHGVPRDVTAAGNPAHGVPRDVTAAGNPAHGVPGGLLTRLDLIFEAMDSSMGRSDLTFGGSTEDEHGRRVPLDEFSAAGIVFLAEALGTETLRARRLLSFFLTPECGLGPHQFAGCKVGWTLTGDDGGRRYGLFCET